MVLCDRVAKFERQPRSEDHHASLRSLTGRLQGSSKLPVGLPVSAVFVFVLTSVLTVTFSDTI
jgi:hypothetical protein